MSDVGMILIKMLGGKEMPRYYDMVHPQKEDNRTGEQIAADIIKRHNLKAVD